MKAKLWWTMAVALLAATPALARRDRPEPQQLPPVVDAVRPSLPPPEQVPPDARRVQNENRGRYFTTIEERRKLRRDINEAGRDIYRPERSEKRR